MEPISEILATQRLFRRATAYVRAFKAVRGKTFTPKGDRAVNRAEDKFWQSLDAFKATKRSTKRVESKFAIATPKERAVLVVSPKSGILTVYDAI